MPLYILYIDFCFKLHFCCQSYLKKGYLGILLFGDFINIAKLEFVKCLQNYLTCKLTSQPVIVSHTYANRKI